MPGLCHVQPLPATLTQGLYQPGAVTNSILASRSSDLWARGRLWDPETGALLAALALSSLPPAREGAGARAAGGANGAAAETGGGELHADGAAEPEAAEEAGVPDACAARDPAAAETEPGGGTSGDAEEPQAAVGEVGADTGAERGAAAPAGQGGARTEAEAGAGDADGAIDGELAEELGHYARAQLPPAVLAVAVAPDGCAPRAQGVASIRHPYQEPPESVYRTHASTWIWHLVYVCTHAQGYAQLRSTGAWRARVCLDRAAPAQVHCGRRGGGTTGAAAAGGGRRGR